MKNIAIIGCTGSIGSQTLDIVRRFPERFSVKLLVAARNVEQLIALCHEFRPSAAIIADESLYSRLKDGVGPLGILAAAGNQAIAAAMERPDFTTVVTATVGYSGLIPTVRAIQAGKEIALANKETLVVAGQIITELVKRSSSRIYPVDSEHSAIYQCLKGEDVANVRRLIITASGGPFRTFSKEQLKRVTVADALRHPNWNMGAKITIDSATMMNKAFEIIEARWLFDLEPSKISALVHPQSIIHSMVEFCDGAIKAQLGEPDMHLPIAYALDEAHRLPLPEALPITKLNGMTFEEPDESRFPCLKLSYLSLEKGGNMACVVNAANEVAVAAFLDGRIKFTYIYPTIEKTLEEVDFVAHPTLDDLVESNALAVSKAKEMIGEMEHSDRHFLVK